MPTNVANQPTKLLTEREAAQRLGLKNSATLAVWRSTGRYALPFVRVGRNIRYSETAVEAFIEANTVGGDGA